MAVGQGLVDELKSVKGIEIGIASAGIKHDNRPDVTVIKMSEGSTLASVFTQNAFCAAPVQLAKQHLTQSQQTRFLVINTGNANAGTGTQGLEDALKCCQQVAQQTYVESVQVLPFSTGVIGEHLPMNKLIKGIDQALVDVGNRSWLEAATAIMTTDTRPKGASTTFLYDGHPITMTGITKGSGMIKPNMATMLAFVAMDIKVESEVLQTLLTQTVSESFNRITVDSDTSTNDACVLIATGQSPLSLQSVTEPLYAVLKQHLSALMIRLAHQIIQDGEGATKFIEVSVESAASEEDAIAIAYSVAESPLVKTALTASDANWGRVLMAVGKVPSVKIDVNKIDLFFGNVCIAQAGERHPDYTEEQGSQVLSQDTIKLSIRLNSGEQQASVWTSDLSYEYIRINAEYRS